MTSPSTTVARRRSTSSGCIELLPHRYPFLMVDRIIEIDGDNSAIGIKNVTVNEPHFARPLSRPAGHAGRAADRGHGPDGRRDLLARSSMAAAAARWSIS